MDAMTGSAKSLFGEQQSVWSAESGPSAIFDDRTVTFAAERYGASCVRHPEKAWKLSLPRRTAYPRATTVIELTHG